MNIRPGHDWGAEVPVPADTPIATSDRDLATLAGHGHTLIALDGGDMWRTLGGRGGVAERLGGSAWVTPIDLADVHLDGRHLGIMAAHLVARGRLWRGETAVVMNAQWRGDADMAPRSHPGDGRLDALVGSLPLRELLQARRRARSGQHLPHPSIVTTRPRQFEHRFGRRRRVWIDHRPHGSGRHVTVTVRPAAVSVLV